MLHEIIVNTISTTATGILLYLIGWLSLKFGFRKRRNEFKEISQIAGKLQELVDVLKNNNVPPKD